MVYDAPDAEQVDILFDPANYSAFPHVVQLGNDELLIAFRQAPAMEIVRHTHPRSIITVMRSYDLGRTWDADGAAQLGAGGGQEMGILYLGQGRVVGALAKHQVAPWKEAERSGLRAHHTREHPFEIEGTFWVWSDNYGITWRLQDAVLVTTGTFACAPPLRTYDDTLLIPTYGRMRDQLPSSSSLLFRSTDGGHTWSESTFIAEGSPQTRGYDEPVLLELEPGHLLAMHRINNEQVGQQNVFWRNESYDGGASWTAPVATGILSGACPRLLRLSDGRLLLTFGRRFEPFGIRAMLSDDGGKSWGDTAWLVRKTSNRNQGYTSSIELADGRIFTASYAENADGVTGIVGTYWRLP